MMELRRGFHHYLLSLPVSRIALVLGRMLGGVVRGVIYQAIPNTTGNINQGNQPRTSSNSNPSNISLNVKPLNSTIKLVKSLEMQATIRSITYLAIFFLSNVFYPESVIKARFSEPLYTIIVNNPISIATSIYRIIFTQDTLQELYQIETLMLKLIL